MKGESAMLPQARQDDLFIEQLGDELLIYDARHNCAHRLNATAAWVWRNCDGEKTIADNTRLLSDRLQQPLDEELVWLSLDTLDKAHLLDTPLQRPSGASDNSRRTIIQKLAVAGGLMFLLPAITPLAKAARAAGETYQGEAIGPGATPLSITLTSPTGKQVKTPAIKGTSDYGAGVRGESLSQAGIYGLSERWHGVQGTSKSNARTGAAGVRGDATEGIGVQGRSESGYGVSALSANGTALYAENQSGGRAALFKGDVEVTGDIRLLNADCAEDFDIVDAESVEAGTVMVLCGESALQSSQTAYDKRVAGVISGAGDYKPGLILDTRPTGLTRKPVALMGKVFCKADARYGAIEAGDLLTTSDTPGHAMKAGDPSQAFGAVIGKALRSLPEGQGLIPILVSLQ